MIQKWWFKWLQSFSGWTQAETLPSGIVCVGELLHGEMVRWQGGGKRKTLGKYALAAVCLYTQWTLAEFRLGLKLGGNSAFAGSEKRGSRGGRQFSLKLSCVRIQARHSWRGVIQNIVEELSSEMLSDSAIQSKKTGSGLRVSPRMLLLCPCLWVYYCFLLLFSLPRLPGAGTHYFCCCHSAVQHERWFKTLLPQTKYNYLRDKWAENYTVKRANGYWTTGRKFCIFNPSELHSPLLLPKQVCNITAGIWASLPFVEACENSMSDEEEEYDLKANTLS